MENQSREHYNPAKYRALNNYKHNAKKRGLEWELTLEEAYELIDSDCFYCKEPPSNIQRARKHTYIYQGIDRIDNKKDYTSDNVIPCCKVCNSWKSDMTYRNFIKHAKKIVDNEVKNKE